MVNRITVSFGGCSFGFCGLLGIVFIVLKLINCINWSWWIVLCPIWGSILVELLILLVVALIVYQNCK